MSTLPPEQPTYTYEPAPQAPAAPQAQPPVGQPAPYTAPYTDMKPVPTNTTVAKTNTYALVAVIVTFIAPIAGIVFGHLGLSQIKRTGDAGRGLALTGLIYGYAVTVASIGFVILYVSVIAMAIGTFASSGSYYYS